jgi:hypothetical protein
MGNYQEYIKGLEASGKAPLREVEPQAIRQHAFGNPFKLDKVSILETISRGKCTDSVSRYHILFAEEHARRRSWRRQHIGGLVGNQIETTWHARFDIVVSRIIKIVQVKCTATTQKWTTASHIPS